MFFSVRGGLMLTLRYPDSLEGVLLGIELMVEENRSAKRGYSTN